MVEFMFPNLAYRATVNRTGNRVMKQRQKRLGDYYILLISVGHLFCVITAETLLTLSQKEKDAFMPSSIYSCSIGHILEHEICHLGCWAGKGKFLKRRNFCLSKQLFEVVFSNF